MRKLTFVLSFLFSIASCQARIIYVDANTPDNNNGSDWTRAYKFLQDALGNANSNGDVNEIRIANGTYKPDEDSQNPDGNGS